MQKTTCKIDEGKPSDVRLLSMGIFEFLQEYKRINVQDIEGLFAQTPAFCFLNGLLKEAQIPASSYLKAFVHTSFIHEFSELSFDSNEKLEFLGDAVLQILISKKLLDQFPVLKEGNLSKLRGALVNGEMLAQLARLLSLGDLILLSKGEILAKGWEKESLLADTFEALIGVIFLYGGYSLADLCFDKILNYYREENGCSYISIERLDEFDPKSRLQEETMRLYKCVPVYQHRETDHQRFEVELYINNFLLAKVEDISKKNAERILARRVLNERLYLNLNLNLNS